MPLTPARAKHLAVFENQVHRRNVWHGRNFPGIVELHLRHGGDAGGMRALPVALGPRPGPTVASIYRRPRAR